MKILKNIGIIVLVILGMTIGPTIAMGFGACAFLGFIVIAGLNTLGIIKIPSGENFNILAGFSFVIGLIIFLVLYALTGWPEF